MKYQHNEELHQTGKPPTSHGNCSSSLTLIGDSESRSNVANSSFNLRSDVFGFAKRWYMAFVSIRAVVSLPATRTTNASWVILSRSFSIGERCLLPRRLWNRLRDALGSFGSASVDAMVEALESSSIAIPACWYRSCVSLPQISHTTSV